MKKIIGICLLMFGMACAAQSAPWLSGELTNKNGQYAGTQNESGGVLAQYCYYENSSCYWNMSSGSTNCTDDESYPALINSDGGALHIDMYCYKDAQGVMRMTFKGFDEIDKAIRSSKKIAIVVPLEGGQFRVSRFDLAGAVTVINSMRASALKKMTNSTKDQKI